MPKKLYFNAFIAITMLFLFSSSSILSQAYANSAISIPKAPSVPGEWVPQDTSWVNWAESILSVYADKPIPISAVRIKPLPFFPETLGVVVLVEAVEKSRFGSNAAYYLIRIAQDSAGFVLDGNGAPILEIAKKTRVALDSATAAEQFLKFFASAISAELGPFTLVDKDANYIPLELKEQLGIRAVRTTQIETGWRITADTIYGDDLYETTFEVTREGVVSMVTDQRKQHIGSVDGIVVSKGRRQSETDRDREIAAIDQAIANNRRQQEDIEKRKARVDQQLQQADEDILEKKQQVRQADAIKLAEERMARQGNFGIQYLAICERYYQIGLGGERTNCLDRAPGISVISLQRQLQQAGYSPGAIDGAWGRKSQAAYESYIRDTLGPPAGG